MKNRLEEIEKRLAAATPGPWEYTDETMGPYVSEAATDNNIVSEYGWAENGKIHENAIFIANAPSDIRDLLAVVKLQREAFLRIKKIIHLNESQPDSAQYITVADIEQYVDSAIEAADKILGGE